MKYGRDASTEARIAAWMASHHGVISRSEAIQLGLSPDQVNTRARSGQWRTLYRSTYCLAGTPVSRITRLRAAVLVGGLGAAVSHRSAAQLWGITANAADDPTDVPSITVPRSRLVRVDGLRVMRSRRAVQAVVRQGLPCTSAIRTLVDCAVEMSPTELDELVDRAIALRLIRADRLLQAVNDPALHHRPGRTRLLSRLKARGVSGAPHPSVLESSMGRLFQLHGLPRPKGELVWGPSRRYRLDFAYPHLRLAIEVDGWSAHFAPEQQRDDNRRANALSRSGWTVLHYDWWEVTYEPERVAAEIADTYRRLAAVA